MPILTKNETPSKGQEAEFQIDKTALAAVTSVSSDTYFSDTNNWKNVIIYYKSSIGNQKELLKFDATLPEPTASFLVSDKARDIFEVQKIIIQDFDGGSIVISRSELTTSEFDVDMDAVPESSALFTRNFATPVPETLDSESTLGSGASLSGGYLELFGLDSQNRNGYSFNIASSVAGIPTDGSGNLTLRLTLSPTNQAVAGNVLRYSGTWQPGVEYTITSQDISNGYIDIPNLKISSVGDESIYFNLGSNPDSVYFRASKIEIL